MRISYRECLMPRHNKPQDELAEQFSVSPLPPITRDGGLELQPLRKLPVLHPRLCEAGPCRNYHRFDLQVDSQDPLPITQTDGSVVWPAKEFRVQTHHYCYPSSGIETELGPMPIIACNRWSPLQDDELRNVGRALEAFAESSRGAAHQAAIDAWKAKRDADLEIERNARTAAAADLATMPEEPEPHGVEIRVALGVPGSNLSTVMRVAWTNTLWLVLNNVPGVGVTRLSDFTVECRGKKLQLEQTVSQAGLAAGDVVYFTKRKDPK